MADGVAFGPEVLGEVEPGALARGKAYWQQGRVTDLHLDEDGLGLMAAVHGSEAEPYEVELTVERKRRGYDLEGFCTCPVGFNCKHVAAALYAALAGGGRMEEGRPRHGTPAAPAIPQTDGPELARWLAEVARAAEPDDGNPEVAEHVRYLLKPPVYSYQNPSLAPVVVRPRQKGGFGVVRTLTLHGLAQSTAQGVTDVDRLIARQINASAGYHMSDSLPMDQTLAAELMQRLLASGRMHWLDLEAPPLQVGPSRQAILGWRVDGQGRQVPFLRVDPAEGDAAEPLSPGSGFTWYVDARNHRCGPLDLPGSLPMIRALLRAPPLDPVAASVVAQRLPALLPPVPGTGEATPPRVELPSPSMTVETDDQPPVIRLQLMTHWPPRRAASRWQPAVEPADRAYLTFDYDGHLVTGSDGPDHFRLVKGSRIGVRHRRTDVELDAIQRIADAGLRPAYPPPGAGGKAMPIPPGQSYGVHLEPEAVWLAFVARTLPELRGEGWQIETAPDFRWRLASVGAWDASVEESGAGWFDLDIAIQVDGQRVALLPLVLALLRKAGDPEALLARDPATVLYAPLPDGQYVALPVARIVPLTRVLLDLFSGTTNLDAKGGTRIDLGQAALLDSAQDLPIPMLLRPEQRAKLRRLLEPMDEAPTPVGLATELRPYQRRGLAWLQALDAAGIGGVLADDMGLGKTLQMIAFLQGLKNEGRLSSPALVVAPTSVVPNWLREGARHAPGLRVHLHQGRDRAVRWAEAEGADLVVTSYPLLLRDHDMLAARQWPALVLDEAQAVKNQAGKLAALVRTLPAGRRFCVTGTPLENHLGELWTQMDFIMPGLLGDSRVFTKTFRTPIEKKGDGDRRRLLTGRLRPFILRRDKAEVAADLPPKTEIVERVPLADDQRDLYETLRLAMDAKVRAAIAARGLARSHIVVLEALLRLRQACCDPLLLLRDAKAKVAASAKRAHLMQMLPELVAEGRRVLVFSQFTTMLDLIRADLDAAGLRHVSLTGDTVDRMDPVDRFQRGEAEIFLISLKAGGTGLTLTAADTVIHYDPWWNPAVEDQATDRAHRIGQDKPVFVYKLVADGTVEDRMLDLQARKRQLAAVIHDAGSDSPGALTAEDIDRLFAPI
ncbi:DEAD/DEAH box helicase [Azospirillum sp. B4]|uniref:DEAD/DEAH box helicase n=1 Tax=Azospirillum sp. B4 TaxID=95605 RepID=UPI00034D6B62|nr:DEAD/DEAH box helicase [Azospirillum sp. B4]